MKPLQMKYADPLYGRLATINTHTTEERVALLIIRDLLRIGWNVSYKTDQVEITPPEQYDKIVIRESMSIKRKEILNQNKDWIDRNVDYAISNLANGHDVLSSNILPEIEVCKTQKQHDLFRMYRYFWSSPYSDYVGRRIKLIVRDRGLPQKPVIGIAALGSPIIHIPERDDFIGWDKETRTQRLNYMMDAYIVGALPPYNYLLGGKLISYIITSNEVREIYERKYSASKYPAMAGVFTTSLYGKSAQYNRINFRNNTLYNHIGQTKGFGTFHLTNETFVAMNELLKENGIIVSNKFGSGPSWSMRVIRTASELLDFDPDALLNHSFKRHIYFVPFASNTIQFLRGQHNNLRYYKRSASSLRNYWKKRWFNNRKRNSSVIENVKWFTRDSFDIWEQ